MRGDRHFEMQLQDGDLVMPGAATGTTCGDLRLATALAITAASCATFLTLASARIARKLDRDLIRGQGRRPAPKPHKRPHTGLALPAQAREAHHALSARG
jgi:hypothetical protein